jgi:regulatory protein
MPLKEVRAAALALLGRWAHTRKGLAEKLKQKGFPAGAIREVIGEFTQKRYLDDYTYALRLAENGLKRKAWSRKKAELELRNKGIEAEERERALKLVYSEVDEVILAQELAAKRWGRSPKKDPQKAKRQLAGYLSRRGFSAEVIGRVLRALFSGEEI